jgi:hypothetical protein
VPVDSAAAGLAGLVAVQFMELPAYVQRAIGKPVSEDVIAENGAILRAPGPWRRPVGWLAHAVAAVLIVLLYWTFFAAVGNDHLLWCGLFAGVPVLHGGFGWSCHRCVV